MSEGSNIARLAPEGYRLRIPGPTFVPERVLQATAQPVVNHRGPEFRAALVDVEKGLLPIFGTKNRILLYAASGSGMMEAAIVNVAGPGDELLIVTHGQFGERFATIAQAVGAQADVLATPWGEDIDIAAVQARLNEKDYRAMVVVHNESSTGVVADLARLGALVRDRPTLLVVDSVSGLGGIEMKQDEWGVDVLVSASQKALMCPPGLGLASISAKAWEMIHRGGRLPSFYWDFRRGLASLEKGETPYTPAVNLVAGLIEALGMIHAEGLPNVLARHARLAGALRAGGAAIGLSDFGPGTRKSGTVVVFDVPPPLDGAAIVRALYQRHRTVIAGARNRLSGKVIRFGTMGAIDGDTILTDLAHLEDTLASLGHTFASGAGVAAARSYLESSRS
jgi:aspartate aminotransferase-like enzyme